MTRLKVIITVTTNYRN